MVAICIKNDEFRIKNVEFCIKNVEFTANLKDSAAFPHAGEIQWLRGIYR